MNLYKTLNPYLKLGLLVTMTGGSLACSKKSSSNTSAPPVVVVPGDDDDTDELTRRCRIPVRFSDTEAHEDALEALVQARINRRERPTTMCVAAESTPLQRFGASLRVEYEDNYGLRWVTFRKRDLIYSVQSSSKFRIIYLDNYGYTQLTTTRNSAGKYSGTVQAANVDPNATYLDEIEEFLENIRTTCNEFPAKCLNPIFTTPTYTPPTEAQILKKANEAFAGQHDAEVHTLGTVTFDPDDIESTLF